MKKSMAISLLVLLFSLGPSLTPGQATQDIQDLILDVPYVPTAQAVVDEMLRMADVKKDDLLYDLGCGDGRIVITAAQRYRCRGVGVDLNPVRIKESKENAVKAEVASLVNFYERDLFKTDFHEATVLSLYLLSSVNLKLRPKILSELKPGTRVVSHNYGMSEWQPDKTANVVVNEIIHTVYFWVVPANVTGKWNISLPPKLKKGSLKLELDQVFQIAQGTAALDDSPVTLSDLILTGDKLQFKLVTKEKGRGEALFFDGQMVGNVFRGIVKTGEGTGVVEGVWKGTRDPSTIKSLGRSARF